MQEIDRYFLFCLEIVFNLVVEEIKYGFFNYIVRNWYCQKLVYLFLIELRGVFNNKLWLAINIKIL